MNYDTEFIDNIIKNAELNGAMDGGCVSFAHALGQIYEVECFPCAFDPGFDDKPLHATVVINNVVFDAKGEHGSDITYVQDWWSGLKMKDYDCDNSDEFQEYLEKEGFVIFNNIDNLRNFGVDINLSKRYESSLRKSINNSE